MELLNATKMTAGYTMGMRPDGRELLVVVVKGTFAIPAPAGNRNLPTSRSRWSWPMSLRASPVSPPLVRKRFCAAQAEVRCPAQRQRLRPGGQAGGTGYGFVARGFVAEIVRRGGKRAWKHGCRGRRRLCPSPHRYADI